MVISMNENQINILKEKLDRATDAERYEIHMELYRLYHDISLTESANQLEKAIGYAKKLGYKRKLGDSLFFLSTVLVMCKKIR